MKNKPIRFVALVMAVLFTGAMALTGCVTKGASSTGQAPASSESKAITVYTALEDDQIKAYLASWNAAHPDIPVKIVRDSTGVIISKLLAEKDDPQADVVWGTAASGLLQCAAAGMIEPYAPAGLDQVQADFRDSQNPPRWVGIDAWFTALAANKQLLAQKGVPIPASYADLIKPEYKGMIVMPDPAASGTGFLTVQGILNKMGDTAGWAYLKKLDKNIAYYSDSGSAPAELAAAGKIPIGISSDYRCVQAQNSSAPIAAVFPAEGSGWDIEANALIKKSQIKPEARTFLDWAISPAPTAEYAKNYPITALKTDTPIPAGYPADPTAQLIKPMDFDTVAANRQAIIDQWTKLFGGRTRKS